jgi:hypothetical protein
MGPSAQSPGKLNKKLHMPLSPSFILDIAHHFEIFWKMDLLLSLGAR